MKALEAANGQVYLAAKMLDCNPVTFYQRFRKFPELREFAQSFKESINDQVEQILIEKATQDKEHWAVTYWLSTQAKHRGYTKREEITGADGGSLVVEYVNNWRDNNQET